MQKSLILVRACLMALFVQSAFAARNSVLAVDHPWGDDPIVYEGVIGQSHELLLWADSLQEFILIRDGALVETGGAFMAADGAVRFVAWLESGPCEFILRERSGGRVSVDRRCKGEAAQRLEVDDGRIVSMDTCRCVGGGTIVVIATCTAANCNDLAVCKRSGASDSAYCQYKAHERAPVVGQD